MKSFATNKPAIDATLVGFGQAGSRIVDVLAKYQTTEGMQSYNCLALNSNEGDLKELRFIDPNNRINLNLGGLGKNPEQAVKILNSDEKVQATMQNFISKKLRPRDELIIFFAGLGGGTGTSTIVKAIEDFHEHYNKPKIKQVVEAMIAKFGKEKYLENQEQFNKKALELAEKEFIKIGVVACLPLRNDGPDVLRQVNAFATKIWELAKDPTKGVSFAMFPDNQLFFDKYQALSVKQKSEYGNYRDYANEQIASTLHELNAAATQGGTSVTLDKEDLKRVWTEHKGCLVISKHELPVEQVENAQAITNMFQKSFEKSNLHGAVPLVKNDTVSKVHHVGLLAVVAEDDFGNGGFLETAVENLHQVLPIEGTVFPGYIKDGKTDVITVYSFYKADALPERLEKGLVAEYNEYIERNRKFKFASASIQTIDKKPEDGLSGLTLDDLGLDDLLGDASTNKKEDKEKDLETELDNFEFEF